jgi:hypothetical protein
VNSPDSEVPEGSRLPEHERRAWDAIVADLSGQIDLGPDFPADPPADAAPPVAPPPVDEAEDVDEGYVPPAPPPLPRPADAVGRFSWAAVIAGPLLIVLTSVLGLDRILANLGVVLTIGGFVALVWRMKDRDDDDDGAVI